MLCHWTIMTKRPNCATLNDWRLLSSLHTNPSQETNTDNKQYFTSSFNYKDNTLHGLKGKWHQTMLRLLPRKIYFIIPLMLLPGRGFPRGKWRLNLLCRRRASAIADPQQEEEIFSFVSIPGKNKQNKWEVFIWKRESHLNRGKKNKNK